MTVGIPGTGIGGLFYLAAAVLLPIRAVLRRGVDSRSRFRIGVQQVLIAGGVLASMWGAGWLLGVVVGPAILARINPNSQFLRDHPGNILGLAIYFAGYITLGTVVLGVQLARVFVRRGRGGISAPSVLVAESGHRAPRVSGPHLRASGPQRRPSGPQRRPSGPHRLAPGGMEAA